MGVSREVILVGVALVVALGVSAVFVVGLPILEGDSTTIEVDGDDNFTPSPTANLSPSTAADHSPSAAANLSFEPGTPPPGVTEFEGFQDVAAEAGLDYYSIFRGTGEITRSGVYIVDFNNNGYEDVLTIGGHHPVLYKNTGGSFERWQEFEHRDSRVAHFFDADNDGYRDLVFAEYGGPIRFYENDDGIFRERSVGLDIDVRSPVAIDSADFTGNGCLDLFVTENGLWQAGHPMNSAHARDVMDNHPDVRQNPRPGGPNHLFFNHDDCSTFTEQTDQAGIEGENWTLAVSAVDFTGNGYPDIHVANDFSTDILYRNRGNGTFERIDMGVETDRNAMASVPVDVTGNHYLDLFVTNIYLPDGVESDAQQLPLLSSVPEGNNLLINQNGSGEFVDEAPQHGLNKGGWGWAAAVEDFTNDGHLDIIHGTSRAVPVEPFDEYRGKMVWKGTPESWERENGTALGFDILESRGLATLDFANTGVLDVVVAASSATQRGGGGEEDFALYENQQSSEKSLQLFVRNPDGVERNVAVYVHTDRRTIYRPVTSGADFLSQNSRLLHFGLANEQLEAVSIFWPDGTESVHEDLTVGQRYIITPDEVEVVD